MAVPVAKVIDFGVAKAINQQLTEKTLFTQAIGQMIGTPQYMSPEQAEMSGLDVDTRSDIYSLGVLLYELLTGRHAFRRRDDFDEAGLGRNASNHPRGRTTKASDTIADIGQCHRDCRRVSSIIQTGPVAKDDFRRPRLDRDEMP